MYTKNLIERGDYNPYDKDKQVLSNIPLDKLIERDLSTIDPDKKLKDLVNIVRKSRRNIYPVVSKERELLGIITLDNIREIMFDEDAQKSTDIKSLMQSTPDTINLRDSMYDVMRKFEKTGAWNLPVPL